MAVSPLTGNKNSLFGIIFAPFNPNANAFLRSKIGKFVPISKAPIPAACQPAGQVPPLCELSIPPVCEAPAASKLF